MALGVVLACARAERPTNVLLIVADTLRADAVDCVDAPDRTPQLCALAARGVWFERAYSSAPWTPPSSVALFTGNHPTAYAAGTVGEGTRTYRVGEAERLFGEQLAERGYTLHHDVENELAVRSGGLQGFEPLHGRVPDVPADDAAFVAEIPTDEPRYRRMRDVVRFLLAAPEPFFVVRWILDPHAAYAAPERFLEDLRARDGEWPRPLDAYRGLGHKRAAERLRAVAPTLSDAEIALVRTLYDREVASVDERVGFALEALRRGGLEERTLVVVTSDHGEGFGEHGIFLHGKSLHEELVRVPLIVAGPGVAGGRRVDALVSSVDVAATLHEWVGIAPDAPLQGRSFADLLRGEPADAAPRAVYLSSSNGTEFGVDAWIEGDEKLVGLADGGYALYDLAADPGERRDLAAERPERVAALAASLEQVRAESTARRERAAEGGPAAGGEGAAAEDETLEALRALGYVE